MKKEKRNREKKKQPIISQQKRTVSTLLFLIDIMSKTHCIISDIHTKHCFG